MRAIHRNPRAQPSKKAVRACNDVGRGQETFMSDCCSVNPKTGSAPAVMPCPVNGAHSKQVDALTVKSLVRQLPLGMPNDQYYFCGARDCDVVYFSFDPQAPIFRREHLMVRVGAKETADPIPICYCFGFTKTFGTKSGARGNQPWRS